MGIEPDVNDEEIKKAYKRLAKLYHPDKNPSGNGEKFKELTAKNGFRVSNIFDQNGGQPNSSPAGNGGIYTNFTAEDFEGDSPRPQYGHYKGIAIGTPIGTIYTIIAVTLNLTLGIPITLAFFPALALFITPMAINPNNPFAEGLFLGAVTGMAGALMFPLVLPIAVAQKVYQQLEKPFSYAISYVSSAFTSKPQIKLTLDDDSWEFITKKKADYEKIDDIERNWTFLSDQNTGNSQRNNSTTNSLDKSIFEKSIENINSTLKVITEHFEKQTDIYESELIITKLEETLIFIEDIEIILNYKEFANQNINSIDDKKLKYNTISKRITTILNQLLNYIDYHQEHSKGMRLLTLVKNLELSLEEYIFNQFEYYQI
ncbi:hypothetical protein DLAC_04825 [Tieghemostelium lacteum]|uniref:J domain-containing protein n=1 Tax=Tieghemostelium lacteum TaxID=361077 RepID=A0A151ZIW2_TIELA|nr:hypothetical protein DLAC_04825 [Tieghemostelium lacteum]|eukprot:KYQ93938.1 hypothetical protein DLAC_04825 [Tieghemostelium lacteum]